MGGETAVQTATAPVPLAAVAGGEGPVEMGVASRGGGGHSCEDMNGQLHEAEGGVDLKNGGANDGDSTSLSEEQSSPEQPGTAPAAVEGEEAAGIEASVSTQESRSSDAGGEESSSEQQSSGGGGQFQVYCLSDLQAVMSKDAGVGSDLEKRLTCDGDGVFVTDGKSKSKEVRAGSSTGGGDENDHKPPPSGKSSINSSNSSSNGTDRAAALTAAAAALNSLNAPSPSAFVEYNQRLVEFGYPPMALPAEAGSGFVYPQSWPPGHGYYSSSPRTLGSFAHVVGGKSPKGEGGGGGGGGSSASASGEGEGGGDRDMLTNQPEAYDGPSPSSKGGKGGGDGGDGGGGGGAAAGAKAAAAETEASPMTAGVSPRGGGYFAMHPPPPSPMHMQMMAHPMSPFGGGAGMMRPLPAVDLTSSQPSLGLKLDLSEKTIIEMGSPRANQPVNMFSVRQGYARGSGSRGGKRGGKGGRGGGKGAGKGRPKKAKKADQAAGDRDEDDLQAAAAALQAISSPKLPGFSNKFSSPRAGDGPGGGGAGGGSGASPKGRGGTKGKGTRGGGGKKAAAAAAAAAKGAPKAVKAGGKTAAKGRAAAGKGKKAAAAEEEEEDGEAATSGKGKGRGRGKGSSKATGSPKAGTSPRGSKRGSIGGGDEEDTAAATGPPKKRIRAPGKRQIG